MPIHKSAAKRMRRSKKRQLRNVAIRSELKTLFKKIDRLISQKLTDEAKEAVRVASSKLDKAATKGVIHKKKASRKKSRLSRKLSRALTT